MATTRLIDVAEAAGVSLRTASRVLNNDHRVAADTRSRVLATMSALNFQPDAVARSLRAGTDVSIGFVVESIADPFFSEVIDSVETAPFLRTNISTERPPSTCTMLVCGG